MQLRAGILSYVLTISILVSTALSMLILYLYYSRIEYKAYDRNIRLLNNLETAVDVVRGGIEDFPKGREVLLDLYGDNQDSISVFRYSWGIYDVFVLSAFKGDSRYNKVVSLGYNRTEEGKAAVYLQDEGRPLAVAGDTKISGSVFLPLAGVQSAYVGRVGYKNMELIDGEEERSEKRFPEVTFKETMDEFERVSGSVLDEIPDTTASFYNQPSVFEGYDLELYSQIKGHVMIKASNRVLITADAQLEDVVVFAPVIELEEGFEGGGQFFVEDTLVINKSVKLKYPTVLAAYNRNKPALITFHEGAEVTGFVLMDGFKDGLRRRVVYLEDGAKFKGMIYVNGMLETYGEICGNVTTRRFLVNAPSAVYENYLFNATIGTGLPQEFLVPSQWFYGDTVQVLKYLY